MEDVQVQRGRMTVVQGNPNTGKTQKLLEAAHKAAREGLIVDYYCCDTDTEGTARARDNFKIPPSDSVRFRDGSRDTEFIKEVIDRCRESRPDVVVIDGFPLNVAHMRAISLAARELNIAFLPSVQLNRRPRKLGMA